MPDGTGAERLSVCLYQHFVCVACSNQTKLKHYFIAPVLGCLHAVRAHEPVLNGLTTDLYKYCFDDCIQN